MRRFFTVQWAGALALTCALAALCVFLGMWQWDRREARLEKNRVVAAHYDAEPVGLADALADEDPWAPSQQWVPVALRGTYDADAVLYVRNRPLNRSPGFFQVVPFRDEASGRTIVVNRGWLPTGSDGDIVELPPPSGVVDVVARLRVAEAPDERVAPDGQAYRIAPGDLFPQADGLVVGGFGVLGSESPTAGRAPVLLPRPETDEGPHLSYSLQWFVFAVGCFGCLVIVARRSDTWRDGSDRTPRPKTPRKPTAEEIEDAIVENLT